MSELPHREEMPAETAARSPAAGLVVWTVGQAVMLGAIWTDMRLSANPAHTAGRMGMAFLMAGQIILSTALLGDLARSLRVAAVAFAISFPVTQLVGWRCAAGAGTSLAGSGMLAIWLAGLVGWMMTARGERARLLVAAGLMIWVVGTPLLWYVLGEFAAGNAVQGVIAAVSPVMLVGDVARLMVVVAVHAVIVGACAGVAGWRRKT